MPVPREINHANEPALSPNWPSVYMTSPTKISVVRPKAPVNPHDISVINRGGGAVLAGVVAFFLMFSSKVLLACMVIVSKLK